MKKIKLPLQKADRLLESGPVVLVRTMQDGQPNVMPMSWHLMHHQGEGGFMFSGRILHRPSKITSLATKQTPARKASKS